MKVCRLARRMLSWLANKTFNRESLVCCRTFEFVELSVAAEEWRALNHGLRAWLFGMRGVL